MSRLNLVLNVTDAVLINLLIDYFKNVTGKDLIVDVTSKDDESGTEITKSVPLVDLTDVRAGLVLDVSRSKQDPGIIDVVTSFILNADDCVVENSSGDTDNQE